VFVAGKNRDSIVLPGDPDGLQATLDGELNSFFSQKFAETPGVYLVLHDGHCLCNYKEWDVLYEYVDNIREANNVDKVALIVFFSGKEYQEIPSVEFDPEIDDMKEPPQYGVIMYVGVSVERRLIINVGKDVSLLFKNGKTVTGTLTKFHSTDHYGEISTERDTVYFNANEIRHIDAIV
jgi:hypothetical protein